MQERINQQSQPWRGLFRRYFEGPLIIGHTDNKGTLDYNLGLSGRRADAVVKALAAKYGIDAKRLTSRGLGPLAPIASNRSEEGQAKNRRVEMVEQ